MDHTQPNTSLLDPALLIDYDIQLAWANVYAITYSLSGVADIRLNKWKGLPCDTHYARLWKFLSDPLSCKWTP